MSKQTAVEWLIDQYELTIGKSITAVMIDEIATAKEMEKKQILLFAEEYDAYVFRGGSATEEQYYNETFNK